jgi:hypothetical protein
MKQNRLFICVFTLAALTFTPTSKANVYATDLKINGSITNAVNTSQGSSVTVSYILNEPATAGVTINVLSGSNIVRTISIVSGDGTNKGTNSVVWDGKVTGGANALETGQTKARTRSCGMEKLQGEPMPRSEPIRSKSLHQP